MNSILIANRGEIASRIIRTCKKMGIRSIAVFSEADRLSPYVRQADSAVFIGNSPPAESYLEQNKIINAAKKVNADAIHPGYGFLSENAGFARACEQAGIIFIGPTADSIEAMGSKAQAKELMEEHGVPVVPGYQGSDQSLEKLQSEAKRIGYPVLLKASAGGGGKGMRIVENESELSAGIESAKREAANAFGDENLILEKYIRNGRHIEIQIFGDHHGNVVHLLERECTIQRRYQKVIEESPSPVIDEKLRDALGEAALKAARALNYSNAGTVEFIFDEQDSSFYFLEVNTRLQVEHPVTEEILGLDLVQMQIETASGKPLSISQADVKGNGYAVEARLYAEDANNGFTPDTGTIHLFDYPKVDGLRVETAIESGSDISVFYDPMIAKLIVKDQERISAYRKMVYVLQNLVCLGVKTNQDFLLQLFQNENINNGTYNTHFIRDEFDFQKLGKVNTKFLAHNLIASSLFGWYHRNINRTLLKAVPSGWRNNFYDYQKEVFTFGETECIVRYRFHENDFKYLINEVEYEVSNLNFNTQNLSFELDNQVLNFEIATHENSLFLHHSEYGNFHLVKLDRFPEKKIERTKGDYEAPMPSQILKVLVEPGQEVKVGDELLILSSMKMENTIYAEEPGVVEEVFSEAGSNVEAGFLLLKIKS